MAKKDFNKVTVHKVYAFILGILNDLYGNDLTVNVLASGRVTANIAGVGPVLSAMAGLHKGATCFLKAPLMAYFVGNNAKTTDYVVGPKGNYGLKPNASKNGVKAILKGVLSLKPIQPAPNLDKLVAGWTTADQPVKASKAKAVPKDKAKVTKVKADDKADKATPTPQPPVVDNTQPVDVPVLPK